MVSPKANHAIFGVFQDKCSPQKDQKCEMDHAISTQASQGDISKDSENASKSI